MHRLAATPGGWDPQAEGVIFVEQTPAPLVILTAADTDIQMLARAVTQLPADFPALRVVNLLQLQQQLTIDTYAETVLYQARAIVLRLLGGRAYWSYGLEVVQDLVQHTRAALFVLPGDDHPDPLLMGHSTVPLAAVNQLWRYFTEGGGDNLGNALKFIANHCLERNDGFAPPLEVPKVGLYQKEDGRGRMAEGGWQGEDGRERMAEGGWQREDSRGEDGSSLSDKNQNRLIQDSKSKIQNKVGILFYRAHYLAGNTAPIDVLCSALIDRGLEPVPVFISSLRDRDLHTELVSYFQPQNRPGIQVLLNTTSFSLAKIGEEIDPDITQQTKLDNPKSKIQNPKSTLWSVLDVPVLQVVLSSGTVEQWQTRFQGLSPRDMAMNVALPEVDGRIISRAISFKRSQTWNAALETDVVGYEPVRDRVEFVADLAANWLRLRQTPVAEQRIALILANYPTRDGRLANGVGLDTPASCVAILQALVQAGYTVTDLPQTGDELIQRLTSGATNDPESRALRPVQQFLLPEDYRLYFEQLPVAVQNSICNRWGVPGQVSKRPVRELEWKPSSGGLPLQFPNESNRQEETGNGKGHSSLFPHLDAASSVIPIPGIQLGNVFVGIQPSRGYDSDPALNYHAPDLEPTHDYLAFYHWIRQQFGAHGIVHVGKHGNLEWLPGKSVALAETCYPEVALGALPHLYPFIVNDPGEGSQAKRRAQAAILDHLTPPMTRAELYGPLQQLESLVDEYYEAQSLDPSRLSLIRDRIAKLILQEHLHQDLGLETNTVQNPQADIQTQIDGYLCELKEAQIRDGLHIFGQCPQGRQLRDLIVSIARQPGPGRLGLTRAIAQDWQLDLDPLTDAPTQPWQWGEDLRPLERTTGKPELEHQENRTLAVKDCRHIGDVIEILEQQAASLIEPLLSASPINSSTDSSVDSPTDSFIDQRLSLTDVDPTNLAAMSGDVRPSAAPGPATQRELTWIGQFLLPALHRTDREITHLLRGLAGRYIPSGPAGAPTRGRPEVLPTGRNFYSVDIRALPTETSWDVGRRAAEQLIERYTQENGEYPQTLALSVWGTSTMRTGGDDIAEALALMGVRPVWDGPSRRVVDFEILPLSSLGRPRVDVTLRISGFFRDAFTNLIDLFDRAVAAVAALEEPLEQNPLAAQVQRETQHWLQAGLGAEQAAVRSRYRIFGSKPGAYGAGLQGLIEAQNWTNDRDLARAYINWSSYAYSGRSQGRAAPEAFEQRLQTLQIVLHNQDNREHDLLDSDDYYQFQGGLTAAVRSLQGKNPHTYFGDHSQPANPRIRHLQEEIARVYRSRVVNPKWIAGVMRHGYKGAFEMAATVDYLFAYDVTTHCVAEHMYEGMAQTYLFDPTVQDFIQTKNPWALRDMAERLLEAHQRGFWQSAGQETLEGLRSLVHQAEAIVENTTL